MSDQEVAPAFTAGQHVQVKTGDPPGHIRTPTFLRGKSGVIEQLHGVYRNPEDLAFGGQGFPKMPLYLVRFSQTEVWDNYDGSPKDSVLADIYQHWLEPGAE
jgi:nitrile hydratase